MGNIDTNCLVLDPFNESVINMMYNRTYHTNDLSAARLLVTGGAGFIGSHIVEYLLKKGAGMVRVLDNFSTGSKSNLEGFEKFPAFSLIEGDIRDLDTCQRAVDGVDYVLHQAALGSVPRSIDNPVATNEVNVCGFLNVLVAARDAGVRRMVYAASSSTYGDHPGLPKLEHEIGQPLSPYAVSKYINELYAGVFSRTYGFHTIGLRYFNVFGPRQDPNGPYAAVIPLFMQAALEGRSPLINGDGETARDFTFVENVVQANIRALFAPLSRHEVANVACGRMTSLNDIWKKVCAVVGISVQPRYGPERKGDIRHSLASIEKARNLFAYEPSVSLEDGLELTLEWAKANLTLSS